MWDLGREGWGMCFSAVFRCPGIPLCFFIAQKMTSEEILTLSFFKRVSFRQKTRFFFVNELERYLAKVVRMDHMDHFGFR